MEDILHYFWNVFNRDAHLILVTYKTNWVGVFALSLILNGAKCLFWPILHLSVLSVDPNVQKILSRYKINMYEANSFKRCKHQQ